MLLLLYVAIGLVSGALMAVIGTGAGLVIIPALILFAHFTAKTAIGTSITLLLPPVGIFAAYAYWKHGAVDIKAGIFIIIGFLIGSFFMARYAAGLPSDTLTRVFGVAAIAIGVKMLFF
jgi:uncharacterized membrane protein YfcA